VVRAREQGLMAGCPTNFAKKDENFYHMYHVVALFELARTMDDAGERRIVTGMARRWLDYTRDPRHAHSRKKSSFADPDGFIRAIARGRGLAHDYDFAGLQRLAAAGPS